MQHPRLGHYTSALFFVALLNACDCGGESAAPTVCSSPDDCEPGQVCVDRACVPTSIAEPNCVDRDGDGRGVMCSAGPDCDDSNRIQTGRERCDGVDNDCDGVADNGVLSSCGNCDSSCNLGGVGGATMPFMPTEENSDGVSVSPDDGALVLDSRRINTNFIWIASTGSGEVSKVDTTTFTEVARYATGMDPSRTSVNALGDVFVGNREGRSVTKVSALGAECPDNNGDGVVTTSTGSTALPFGQDDCVLWRTDLPDGGIVRAVAAQDVYDLEGELKSYVWAGGWNGVIYKLDGDTGAILLRLTSPTPPYGFALDGAGRLWIGSLNNGVIGMLNTTMCTTQADCEAAATCTASSPEGAECDAAVKARIPTAGYTYGITVDAMQRVWFGGHDRDVQRYDMRATPRWASAPGTQGCYGIGADANSNVFGACQARNQVIRIDGNTLASHAIDTGPNRGIAIDSDGKVWAILMHTAPAAAVIIPGADLTTNTLMMPVGPALASPYTYSDMTGAQLRLATNPRGFFRHVLEGCGTGYNTDWSTLEFDAVTPSGTDMLFRVRTASSREGLATAEWIVIGMVPPQSSPLDVAAALQTAAATRGQFLEVEVQLRATRSSNSEVITPRLRSVNVKHFCAQQIG